MSRRSDAASVAIAGLSVRAGAAEPDACNFLSDRITRDQVDDYARRKGMKPREAERHLASNLGCRAD